MTCPFCGNDESRVVDSRDSGQTIRRRRECLKRKCKKRWTTKEYMLGDPDLSGMGDVQDLLVQIALLTQQASAQTKAIVSGRT